MRYLILFFLASPCLADAQFEAAMLRANRAQYDAVAACKESRYPGYCQDIANARWRKSIARAEAAQANRTMWSTIREQDARIEDAEKGEKQ